MKPKTMRDLLPFVEMPSRYLGSEVNIIKKDAGKVKLNFALAFPDLYEIGTSHFGIQILYTLLNRHRDIWAQRVFAPAMDMERRMRDSGAPLSALESGAPLKEFDILGFSLLYELNYTNMLGMLDLAGIPFYSAQRDGSFPMLIAGGPCMCDPEPVADFFDAVLIGDGEKAALEMADAWLLWKAGAGADKNRLLDMWSKIDGVYIPSFYTPVYDQNGFQTLLPADGSRKPPRVSRAVVPDLDAAPFPLSPIVPFGRPVHDRLRLEVMRGCCRGCRFCQAGMIYRPVRERSVGRLLDFSAKSLDATGYDELSLLSLSTGDFSRLTPLMEGLMRRHEKERVAVSLPSLRADALTPGLMELIKRVRKTGFTIAPEAGTQRMRDVINKNISEDEIVSTVRHAFSLGWQVIKLYFMVGLPGETDADVKGIADLARSLWRLKEVKSRGGRIHVSVAAFVPKPHTPFQWASQAGLEESREKIEWLKRHIRMPGTRVKWQNPQLSLLEGLWARGDRRLSKLLETAFEKGCRFDGWSDHFQFDLWMEAISETGIDADFFTQRQRDTGEPLPWDFIGGMPDKAFLKAEWARSLAGEKTPDCRGGECGGCGVCDFDAVKIREASQKTLSEDPLKPHGKTEPSGFRDGIFQTLAAVYSKTGKAKYFGHLEMAHIFLRALRRSGIPVRHSQGFHPKPKVSFEDSLPIHIESLDERFYIETSLKTRPEDVAAGLNETLPEGLEILDCFPVPGKKSAPAPGAHHYRVRLKTGEFRQRDLDAFLKADEWMVLKKNKKGKEKKIDLKKMARRVEMVSKKELKMTVALEGGQRPRPPVFLKEIFSLDDDDILAATIVKTGRE
ncbi:B12-binding domain-containing radical SAM protein [Candidatus Desulfarcum epimagneticum]|uniref:B12-binding domain-containing radical SAM protein n=1 Tax=uncultured Desulfobacteraceae bacterium TaxID=218296 RepID=A0A484HGM4_9BACT|nr:B12-binding domain-containing radical SAM protein [uncultured Desulfobacteraceae bacterium]